MRVPVTIIRGGTSKGLFLNPSQLPPENSWPSLFPRLLGSGPDGNQRDGLGGGSSSTSKICVVSRLSQSVSSSSHGVAGGGNSGGRVQLRFFQVGIKDGKVDETGTCGNLISAVPLFAHLEGFSTSEAVRIYDYNTKKDIVTTLTDSGISEGGERSVECKYLDVGGTKTGHLFPCSEVLNWDGVRVSIIDGPNPTIMIPASDLQMDPLNLSPSDLARLEELRIRGIIEMGLATSESEAQKFQAVPKITLLSPADGGLRATTLSMGVPHRAIPITIALSLALAMKKEGTVAYQMKTGSRIFHPGGFVDVNADLEGRTASVMRTARVLMKGEAFV